MCTHTLSYTLIIASTKNVIVLQTLINSLKGLYNYLFLTYMIAVHLAVSHLKNTKYHLSLREVVKLNKLNLTIIVFNF